MARTSPVVTKTLIDSTTFGNALITDYMSQTSTTNQALASNVDFATGKRPKADFIYMTPTTAPAATEGHIYYDSTAKKLLLRNDSSWLTIPAAGGGGGGAAFGAYTYYIYTDGTDYYAYDNSGDLDYGGSTDEGAIDGADCSAVVQAAIDNSSNGSTIFFGVGNFGDAGGGYFDVDMNNLRGLRFVGSGRGNDTSPYGGTVIECAANGGFDISHTTDEQWFTYFSDMTLVGGNRAASKGVHSDNATANKKTCQVIIERCHFTGFTAAGAIAIDITNHEWTIIQNNHFTGWPTNGVVILLECNNYFGGNVKVLNNAFISTGNTGADMVQILTSDAKENDNYEIAGNQTFSRDYPCYLVHFNAASGAIKQTKIHHNRMEYMNLVRCSGATHIQDVDIHDNNCASGTNLAEDIEITSQARSWLIHDNAMGVSAGRTQITDASSNASYPCRIYDNDFNDVAGALYTPTVSPPTKFNTIVAPFVDGTTFLSADGSSWGWEIDAATDYSVATATLPPNATQLIKIVIKGVSLVAEADAMRLEIDGYAGASNQAEGTETIDVVDCPSDTTNFAADDYIEWTLTASDDTDIDEIHGGDTVQIKCQHEAAGGADCETDCVLQAVELHYI